MDTGSICYKRNYLTQVVARVDFLKPIEQLGHFVPVPVSQAAKKCFPIAEPSRVIAQGLQLTADSASEKSQELMEWHYHGRNRDKTLTIGNRSILVLYTRYTTYDALRDEFLGVLAPLLAAYENAQPKRLGLRYINNIVLDESDPLDWGKYISEKLLSIVGFYPDAEPLARAMSVLEYNFGDCNLRFQFGMHNPDYPAPIRRKHFVLDFDSYYQGLLERPDIAMSLDKFHDRVQELFEMCITDEFRSLLRA